MNTYFRRLLTETVALIIFVLVVLSTTMFVKEFFYNNKEHHYEVRDRGLDSYRGQDSGYYPEGRIVFKRLDYIETSIRDFRPEEYQRLKKLLVKRSVYKRSLFLHRSKQLSKRYYSI